ncbi:MAG TPA: cyclic nucleotide-binding domain-containing protein [Gaiellaceae bacterium]|nr:cyclic nucleotide-binding domain-containing protein [Gaiellaceae bacterium]
MSAPVELLQHVRLFENVEKKELERIAGSFKERTFNAGDVIAQEGSSGIGFFVIESGTARATHGDIVIGELGPGSSFGEVALIDEGPRSATVIADSELKCWGLSAWEFRPLAETNATVAWNLARIVAGYVRLAAGELDKQAES